MNTEIIKAMQSKKEHKVYKWWRKNSYKIWRVVLFPLWFGLLAWNEINKHLNDKQEWNEERINEILNYYIPRRAHWDKENNCFYFFDNGTGWNYSFAKKFLKRKDRRFWKVNCGWWGGKIRTFMIEKFELEGFTKVLGVCDETWTEITYYLKK